MARRSSYLTYLALGASFFAWAVIALGALTRLLDAGLGCPDWPGCYGHLIVPLSDSTRHQAEMLYPSSPFVAYKAWAEMVHRYFVGGLSLLILIIISSVFWYRVRPEEVAKRPSRRVQSVILRDELHTPQGERFYFKNRDFKNGDYVPTRKLMHFLLVALLILLLIYQIILGQLTVTLKLLPIIVTQHLLGGFLILSTLWLVYLNTRSNHLIAITQHQQAISKRLLPFAWLALLSVFLQIILGAWTSTHYASLSCPDFPFCFNDQAMHFYWKEAFNLFSPIGINYSGGVLANAVRQTIQMAHRLGALIVTLYFLTFFLLSFAQLKKIPDLMRMWYVMLGLLSIQLCLGISNVLLKLPVAIAVAHTLVAVLLLLSVMTFIFKLYELKCGEVN